MIKHMARNNFYFFDFVKHHEAATGTQYFTYEDEREADRKMLGEYKAHNKRIKDIRNPKPRNLNGNDAIESEFTIGLQLTKIRSAGEQFFKVKA